MRISDWSSDVCSSDLLQPQWIADRMALLVGDSCGTRRDAPVPDAARRRARRAVLAAVADALCAAARSEEHTSELQSLMRISYAVFCLKKKKKPHKQILHDNTTTKKIVITNTQKTLPNMHIN